MTKIVKTEEEFLEIESEIASNSDDNWIHQISKKMS